MDRQPQHHQQPHHTLNPQIMTELENLNSRADDINSLEVHLEAANYTHKLLLNESSYHDAAEKARAVQIERHNAVVRFKRANEIHGLAKETLAITESHFRSNSSRLTFDDSWQDMINNLTLKVVEAGRQKDESSERFCEKKQALQDARAKVRFLEWKVRSRLEGRTACEEFLKQQPAKIEELKTKLGEAKSSYSQSLRNLEEISERIHEERKKNLTYFETSSSCRSMSEIDNEIDELRLKVHDLYMGIIETDNDAKGDDRNQLENEIREIIAKLDELIVVKMKSEGSGFCCVGFGW
jgi:DNA-binding transcriptional regulator GbsR (MarR family)